MHIFSGFTSIAMAAPLLLQASAPTATPDVTTAPVKIVLTASKNVYRAGEPVLLKVQIVNTSSEPVRVMQLTPWDTTALVVVRDGAAIAQTGRGAGYEFKFPYPAKIDPGGTMTLHWQSDLNPITYWGYAALQPGHYVVTVVPKRVEGRTQSGKSFFMDSRLHGNTVQFDVEQ